MVTLHVLNHKSNISPAEDGGNDHMTGVLKLQESRLSDKLYMRFQNKVIPQLEGELGALI